MVGTKMDRTWQQRTTEGAYKRPNFPNELKRRLVEQSLEPGASLSLIARDNDINANLLFKWRRRYFEGAYGMPAQPAPASSTVDWKSAPLLPVNLIAETAESEPAKPSEAVPPVENVCEVEFDHARLRIRGDVSPTILRLLIRELSQ
jgi:transposase